MLITVRTLFVTWASVTVTFSKVCSFYMICTKTDHVPLLLSKIYLISKLHQFLKSYVLIFGKDLKITLLGKTIPEKFKNGNIILFGTYVVIDFAKNQVASIILGF